MGEGTTQTEWRDIDRRHRVGILLGAAVVLVAAGAAFALWGARSADDAIVAEATQTVTPAEETTETTVALPEYESVQSVPSATEVDAESAQAAVPGAASAAPTRVPIVAYRRDGWLCVSAEDGSGERRVAECPEGVFSLSPDGATIACVEVASGSLRLYDVGSGAAKTVASALQDEPDWAPDSAWLVYTAPGPKITRVGRDGSGSTRLMTAEMPSVSHDGGAVVGASATSLVVWRGGSVVRHPTPATVSGVACGADRAYYGSGPDASGAVALRSMALDGGGDRAEVAAPTATRPVSFGPMRVSPDGAWLGYTERGDDGYSRLFALPTGGGQPVSLSIRRDCYPVQWSAGGRAVFFVEGNVIQGDPTSLVSATPADGLRRTLTTGVSQ